MNEFVSQYQEVFNFLWEKAIPVEERIREIKAFEVGNVASGRNEEKPTPSNRAVTSQPILEPSSEHEQQKESIEKETEALLNTRIPDYNKNTLHPPIKIQLWSNKSKTDFAIKLKGKSDFLAATRKVTEEEYTDLVEESDYLEDVQYDWNYTLRHWIDNRARNINTEFTDFASVFRYDKTIATSIAGTSNSATKVKGSHNDINNSPTFKEIQTKTYSHQKGTLKCNYCKLMFTTRMKREQHEKVWHTAARPARL
jgi:hypothetical protein